MSHGLFFGRLFENSSTRLRFGGFFASFGVAIEPVFPLDKPYMCPSSIERFSIPPPPSSPPPMGSFGFYIPEFFFVTNSTLPSGFNTSLAPPDHVPLNGRRAPFGRSPPRGSSSPLTQLGHLFDRRETIGAQFAWNAPLLAPRSVFLCDRRAVLTDRPFFPTHSGRPCIASD